MPEFLSSLFGSDFLPHGVCYRWSPGVVWLHATSDLLIALAYYFIPFSLIHIVRSRRDLVYPWMFWLFGLFILACGTTHLMSIWVIWHPVYRLDGAVKLVTALASVPTAILLMRLAPAVIALPSPEQLRVANARLEDEIRERRAAEDEVRRLNTELENRVTQRTQELQEANDRLQESERRMYAILDTAPLVVFMKDLAGRYVFVNRRFEDVYGRRREGLVGRTDHDLFPQEAAEAFRKADRDVIESGNSIEVEEIAYYGAEKRAYISLKFPLIAASGQPYALCGMSTDITDRKNAEQSLRRYNIELEQFAFVVSHDLQEPLRTVKSYAQLLAKRYSTTLDGDARDFLGFITAGVDRMSMLINDLQTYTEVANRTNPGRAECDLNTVLSDTRRNLQASIVDNGAEITADPLPTVIANPRQMGQLFQNLLSNSIKYRSERAPKVHISASRNGSEWLFRFSDNGIGFEMKYAEQIFGVFKRLHGREIPGTGIGLAICKQIVDQHGGRMWVESTVGEGTSFSFSLPA